MPETTKWSFSDTKTIFTFKRQIKLVDQVIINVKFISAFCADQVVMWFRFDYLVAALVAIQVRR